MRVVAHTIDTPGCPHAGWEAATWDDGDHVHVLPLGDAITHGEDAEGDCICGPAFERLDRPDGDGWIISHHALDGRPD